MQHCYYYVNRDIPKAIKIDNKAVTNGKALGHWSKQVKRWLFAVAQDMTWRHHHANLVKQMEDLLGAHYMWELDMEGRHNVHKMKARIVVKTNCIHAVKNDIDVAIFFNSQHSYNLPSQVKGI